MATPTHTYAPRGFRRYGSASLFAGALVLSLVVNGAAVYTASGRMVKDVDITQLAIVDVKKARQLEMQREITLAQKKAARGEEPKPEPKPEPTSEPEKAPPPQRLKAPPPPVLRVKTPPKPAPTPAPTRVVRAPRETSAPRPTRDTRVTRLQPNAGSRLDVRAGSNQGDIVVGGEGHSQAGETGAGTGSERGSGTGAGRGIGDIVPNPNPPGDAPTPPPPTYVEPTPPPTPPVVVKPPPPKPPPVRVEPDPPVVVKPPPPKEHVNRLADRAEAQILSAPAPEAPSWLYEEGGGGQVVVRFTVTAEGTITNVSVVRSDDPRLNSAALKAARRIKAKPAVQDGIPRDTVATYTYLFRSS